MVTKVKAQSFDKAQDKSFDTERNRSTQDESAKLKIKKSEPSHADKENVSFNTEIKKEDTQKKPATRQKISASKPIKTPQTMEDLLASSGFILRTFKRGDVVEGRVSRVTKREINVDIGGKTEAVVITRELENYKDALMALKVGDIMIARIIVTENDRGQPVVSLRQNIFEKCWQVLREHKESGLPLEVLLKEPVRGGILVDYGGVRGYIPQSQLDASLSKQIDRISGRKIEVKVIEVDKESNRLVFSQRAISEAAALEKQKEFMELIKEGEVVEAEVTGIVPFGAFAKIIVKKEKEEHEIEGLIHISEIAWEKVEDPAQYMKAGDRIKVKIVGIDKYTGKVTLSLKQLLPDPWEDVLDLFEKDSQVQGKVTRITPYGVFVHLSPGIEGLIHISKISPGSEPKVGDTIECIIEEIYPDKRKISLTMALKEKPIGYR